MILYLRTPNKLVVVNKQFKKGFALISTILVMSLLMMVAIASLSISSMETRSAGLNNAKLEAEANARMALMLAIAHLQEDAGRDDRATAPAGQKFESLTAGDNPNWTAVYRVRKKDDLKTVVGRHDSEHYLTDLRNEGPEFVNDELFISYLVSQNPDVELDPTIALEQADSVELLGVGSSDTALKVTAPLVAVKSGDKQGAYAYWIGDESTKARLDLQPKNDLTEDEKKAQFQRLCKVDLAIFEKYTKYKDLDADDWKKVMSYNTSQLLDISETKKEAKDLSRDNYLALTVLHEGLLTNPLQGGFKKDLSAFLNQPLSVEEIAASKTERNDALKGGAPIIVGKKHEKTSPKFDALRRYNLMRHLVEEDASSSAMATLDLSRNLDSDDGLSLFASQRDLGEYQRTEMGGSLPDITAVDRPNIQPILAESSLAFDFSCYKTTDSSGAGAEPVYGLRCHLYPTIKLWNPYNVTLKTPPYIALISCLADANRPNTGGAPQACSFTAGMGTSSSFIQFFGVHNKNAPNSSVPDSSQVRRYFGFTIPALSIKPGETLVLSPDWQKGSGKLSSPGARGSAKYEFDFSKNLLSPKVPNGEGSFYFDFKNQTAKPKADYGFQNDIWLPERGAGEQTILKAVAKGGLNNLTYDKIALNAGTAKNYPTVAYVNTNPSGLYYDMNGQVHSNYLGLALGNLGGHRDATKASGIANGLGGGKRLQEFDKVDIGPPPRFWRYGNRLLYYDELGGDGIMNGFSYGRDVEYSNLPIMNSWNPRAPMSHTGWANQNSVWGWWTTGVHHKPRMFPLMNGSEGDAPTVSKEGNYISHPMAMGEGRASEPNGEVPFILYDLPRKSTPLMSLASLQHAQLSYNVWHPNYIIGHGFADGRSASGATISTDKKAKETFGKGRLSAENNNRWKNNAVHKDQYDRKNGRASWGWMIQDGAVANERPAEKGGRDPGFGKQDSSQEDEILIYDIAYETNHALWDKFFISGLEFEQDGKPTWDDDTSLNLGGISPSSFDYNAMNELSSELLDKGATFAYHETGRLLTNKGAFNVNSTSVEAWRLILSSIRNLKRTSSVDGEESVSQEDSPNSPYSSILYTGIAEGEKPKTNADDQLFAGFRGLTDKEVDELAQEIVNQVRLRGPFLSLSDFVNRRLVDIDSSSRPSLSSRDGTALMSPLEAAIELSGINDSLHKKQGGDRDSTDDALPFTQFEHWGDKRLAPEWKASGLPGYLSQRSILNAVGSSLTTRGDTFVIRTYGESRSATGAVLARAYCEAVVQRTPNYTNPSDDPLEPILIPETDDPSETKFILNTELSETSHKFGRKFIITRFKWLKKDEI